MTGSDIYLNRLKQAAKVLLWNEKVVEVNRGLIARYVARSIPKDAVFVECGSFTGNGGKKFAELAKLNPENCHLIEACPQNFKIMQERYAGFKVHNLAVSGKEGTLPFYVVDVTKWEGTSVHNSFHREHLEKRFGKANVQEVFVRSVPLGMFFRENNLPRVDYLFMNVEGAEYDIFENNTDFLDHVHFFYLDMHSITGNRKALKFRQKKIFDLIVASGFEHVGGHRREHIDIFNGHLSFLWEKTNKV